MMTDGENEMWLKVRRIESGLVEQKRLRRQKLARGEDVSEQDVELAKMRKAAGRIRAHLKRGVYAKRETA